MKKDIDRAAKMLLKMHSPPKTPRPSRPNAEDAARKFRLAERRGKPRIEEVPK